MHYDSLYGAVKANPLLLITMNNMIKIKIINGRKHKIVFWRQSHKVLFPSCHEI